MAAKAERENRTREYLLPTEVFAKNRTVSKENQEKLLQTLMRRSVFDQFWWMIRKTVTVESFYNNFGMLKILDTFSQAGLIDVSTKKLFLGVSLSYCNNGFKGLLEFEIKKVREGRGKSIDVAYSSAFKSMRGILEHSIPKIISLFESIFKYVADKNGEDTSLFSLSHVRRFYETGVKTVLGEALIEYGFPTDAVRRIEESHKKLFDCTLDEAKQYCRDNYNAIRALLDSYENQLFIKAMRSV